MKQLSVILLLINCAGIFNLIDPHTMEIRPTTIPDELLLENGQKIQPKVLIKRSYDDNIFLQNIEPNKDGAKSKIDYSNNVFLQRHNGRRGKKLRPNDEFDLPGGVTVHVNNNNNNGGVPGLGNVNNNNNNNNQIGGVGVFLNINHNANGPNDDIDIRDILTRIKMK